MNTSRGLCTATRAMNKHYVFIYGTLKQGEPNHYWLNMEENGYSKFISNAQTVVKYPMIISSRHNIPFLLDNPGTGENVLGEVYEVDDMMLHSIDEVEDHPTIYIREIERVALLQNGIPGENLDCWMYFLRKFKPKYLNREFHKEYSSRVPQGQRFLEIQARDPSRPSGSGALNC